ncbi:hypothetical protein MtrunA17_Chr4g0076101 [Medicago truncatula]|uniref:Uncharacterized protein n=1 Tax=Medicago truncatula TaxID=3880 RepID=A0A396IL82_MEDTR|nr:hypothetical protein MtrunA17_Chr4g0076101 [Medicago truncatula]
MFKTDSTLCFLVPSFEFSHHITTITTYLTLSSMLDSSSHHG